jgi:probable rRNA maturation factor
MSRVIDVSVRHPRVRVSAASVVAVVQALDRRRSFRCPPGTLSIAFLGDRETAKVHADYLDDPSVTDVITFPGEDHPGEPFAGEICVNIDQARRAAKEQGTTLAGELRLYVVHGWLHLAGLLDGTKAQCAAMRAGEAAALAHLDRAKRRLRVVG